MPVSASSSSFWSRSVSSRGADSGRTTDGRVAVEGDDRAAQAPLGGPAADLADHRPVAEVDAVVGADGDGRALRRRGHGRRSRSTSIGRAAYRPPG